MNEKTFPNKTAARRKARRFAVQALYQWQMTRDNLSAIETQFRTDNDMRKTDVAYFHEMLHGIPQIVDELDNYFRPYLDRSVEDLDQVERAILRLGTFELLKRVDVPFRVVINEAVELAKMFGATESHKYVNGILDKVAQRARMVEIHAQRARNAGGQNSVVAKLAADATGAAAEKSDGEE